MAITTDYRSANGEKRYVRACRKKGWYFWVEVQNANRGVDCAQGGCQAKDLPDDVRKAADARFGTYPSYVDWPL